MSSWSRKFLTSFVLVFFSLVGIGSALHATATEPTVQPKPVDPGVILEGGVQLFGLRFNKGIVEQFELHLDKASPLMLAGIAAYYYHEKNIEKATFYYQAALLRINIDAKIVPDDLIEDYPSMITMVLGDFFFEYEQTKKLFLHHLDSLLKAKIEVVEWDKKTPRSYGLWEIINQDHERVKQVIQETYTEWTRSEVDLTNEVMRYKKILANKPDDQNVSDLFNQYYSALAKENNRYMDNQAPGVFIEKKQ